MRKNLNKLLFVTLMTYLSLQSKANDLDEASLRQLDKDYAAQWIAGNADGVINLFTDDATLVPHHGDQPILGKESIRQVWFDPSYPPTIIPSWQRDIEEVLVYDNVGIVRGRATLVFDYNGVRTNQGISNYVMVAEKQDGIWKIRMLTWNDDPRDWVRTPLAN